MLRFFPVWSARIKWKQNRIRKNPIAPPGRTSERKLRFFFPDRAPVSTGPLPPPPFDSDGRMFVFGYRVSAVIAVSVCARDDVWEIVISTTALRERRVRYNGRNRSVFPSSCPRSARDRTIIATTIIITRYIEWAGGEGGRSVQQNVPSRREFVYRQQRCAPPAFALIFLPCVSRRSPPFFCSRTAARQNKLTVYFVPRCRVRGYRWSAACTRPAANFAETTGPYPSPQRDDFAATKTPTRTVLTGGIRDRAVCFTVRTRATKHDDKLTMVSGKQKPPGLERLTVVSVSIAAECIPHVVKLSTQWPLTSGVKIQFRRTTFRPKGPLTFVSGCCAGRQICRLESDRVSHRSRERV